MKETNINNFFIEKVVEAKRHFERVVDCKHTEFDDLYPRVCCCVDEICKLAD